MGDRQRVVGGKVSEACYGTRTAVGVPTCIALLVLASACGQSDESGHSAAPSLSDFENATYQGFEGVDGPVTLSGGVWTGEVLGAGGAARSQITLAGGFYRTGDLDEDEEDEAVVLLHHEMGGSGTFAYLAVLDRHDGAWRSVATELLGDRVQLRHLSIEEGRLLADVVQAGPSDAACCPGDLVSHVWTLLPDGRLNAVAVPEVTGRLGLGELTGVEWALHAWDRDDAATGDIEVTLSYADGQFTGSSGCNRFFTSASEGGMPGDLSVGPIGATRMACPDDAMAVETRFFEQLGSVKRYGFVATRLALSYERDGHSGVMLFDANELQP